MNHLPSQWHTRVLDEIEKGSADDGEEEEAKAENEAKRAEAVDRWKRREVRR